MGESTVGHLVVLKGAMQKTVIIFRAEDQIQMGAEGNSIRSCLNSSIGQRVSTPTLYAVNWGFKESWSGTEVV